jgi:ribosomal protein L25 (general stress protein Ctc)
MERVTLNVKEREKCGKGVARSLRRSGIISAILYRGGYSLPVQISGEEITSFIHNME